MNYYIIVNAYIKNTSQLSQASRLAEELRNMGADCEIIKNINLAAIFCGEAVSSLDGVCVFLDKDRAAARLLEAVGLRLINSSEAMEICDDKFLTHIALSNKGIAMPSVFYAPLCYYPDARISEEFLSGVADKLGFPLVAKKCFGSLGEGVSLIRDYEQLREYEQKNKLSAHFYQKFIGCGGEDIRVILIGGKYVCAMRRSNPHDFRSNVEQGGKGERIEADTDLIDLCEKTASVLKLDYCGVDVLTDVDGKRYICEVNSNAFFAEAERVCKVNIAKKFAELIIAK